MTMRKTSPIWGPSREEFQEIVNKSSSFVEVISHFNLNPYSGNHKTLHTRILEENVDISILDNNRKKATKEHCSKIANKNKTSIEDIFKIDSNFHSRNLKKKILQYELIEYKCSGCDLEDEWNGKPLNLQIDHINGISNDNRIENLRFLCPNCHSQTETYAGKNKTKKLRKCKVCQKEITDAKKADYCSKCRDEKKYGVQTKLKVSKKELKEKMIELNWNYSAAGRFYKVSDNTVKKWCKKYNLI
jgi:Zn finger protein HypA/HybF involved in hydrogenase expression